MYLLKLQRKRGKYFKRKAFVQKVKHETCKYKTNVFEHQMRRV